VRAREATAFAKLTSWTNAAVPRRSRATSLRKSKLQIDTADRQRAFADLRRMVERAAADRQRTPEAAAADIVSDQELAAERDLFHLEIAFKLQAFMCADPRRCAKSRCRRLGRCRELQETRRLLEEQRGRMARVRNAD
jgi:hypothetical protein